MPYETWYYLHLNGYLAVALGFGHQVFLGQTFQASPVAFIFWVAVYVAVAVVIMVARLGGLARSLVRPRIEVRSVERSARGTVILNLGGPGLTGLTARAGQFVSVRFLHRGLWWQSHPFSLSAVPTRDTLRLTIKNLGDATETMQHLRPGTRVKLLGPYGRMSIDRHDIRPVLLVGAGVGLAPMRALLEDCTPDQHPVVIARAHTAEDIPHLAEMRGLAAQRFGQVITVLGPRHQWTAGNPFTAQALNKAIPDLSHRTVFLCGPPALQNVIERSLRRAGVAADQIHSERFGW